MQRPNPETVTLNDILITQELSQRAPRPANLQAENQAMRLLGRQMAQASESLMQTLADTALELCRASTAGVSLLEITEDGEQIFRWNVLAGTLAHQVGGTTPRNFSPCNVCLEQGSPVLFSHPEYYFTDFQEANTPLSAERNSVGIVEELVLPLVADSHVLGTIWIMSHDEERHFDSEDVRVMTSLADFTATALLLQQRQTGELLATNATLETEIVERKQAEERTQALISNLPGGAVFVVDRDLRYLLAEGEALAIAGFKPEDFVGHTIFEALPSDLAASYEPLYRQALAGEPFEHEHNAHNHTYISRGTPLRAENGEIYAVLVVSYDITERKQTEAQLSEAQRRLELSLAGANLGTWTYRVTTDEFWADDRALHLHGHAPGEVHTFADAGVNIHPDDRDQTQAALAQALQTHSKVQVEYRVIWTDGSVHWIASYAEFMPSDEDEGMFYGIALDITERKQSEAALRESEENFRTFVNASSDIVYKMSADWSVMQSLVGKQFIPSTVNPSRNWLATYIPEDEQPRVQAAIEAAIRTKRNFELEHRVIREDGTIGWTFSRAIPLLNEQGDIVEWLGAASDVTERKHAEAALRESEERLQKAISIETVGVLFFNLDGQITDANDTFLRMSGYSRDELRNIADWHDLTSPEFWDATSCAAEELATLGKTAPYEKQHIRKDGSRGWGLFSPMRLKGSGRNSECVEFVIDISERKRVEAAIAADLRDTQLLRDLGARLITEGDIQSLYQEIMTVAITLMQSDAGTVQILDEATQELLLLATQGFEPPMTEHFYRVDARSNTPCGRALAAGDRIFMDFDVPQSEDPDGSMRMHVEAGYLSAQSTPLISRSGKPIGMVSTHWRQRYRPSERELRFFDLLVRQAADLIEQRQAEAALRESEQKYRTLFDSIDEGFAITEIIYDDQGEIVDIIYRQVNRAYERHSGVYDAVGRSIFDIIPGVEDYWLDLYKRVARTGESVREENYQQDVDRWFDVYFSRIDDNGRFVAIVFSDISDRKQREAILRENEVRQAFLLQLSDILQQFMQPNDIKAAAMRLLGEHLGVSRAQYHECDFLSGEYYSAEGVGYANGLPLLDLKYRIDAFGTFVNEDFAAGRPYRSDDLEVDPRVSAEERDAYRIYQIRAGAGVPLIRGGKLVAILAVHDVHPHPWTDLEMDLIRETAERIWTPLERARAQEALRESEAKYRSLFESINDGFALLEVLYDDDHQPIDCRFLEVSPSFEAHTTLPQAQGKTLRELIPSVESGWFEHYHQALVTNAPVHFEMYQSHIKIWFEVDVFPYGNPRDRQVVIVFQNINDRKRAEEQLRCAAEMDAFRVKLSDALQSLSDPIDIQRAAMHVIGEHLAVDRVFYANMMPDDVTTVIHDNYVRDGVPKFVGSFRTTDFDDAAERLRSGKTVVLTDVSTSEDYTEAEKAAYAGIGMNAALAVPLVKANRWVANLGIHSIEARCWTDEEVALVQETAERTWAAVERARAEDALRESEVKYRTLFKSIDQGYCLIELILNQEGKPIDWLYLEANQSYQQQTGLGDMVGKRLLEFVPNLEPEWFDFYGNVARTGEPARLEYSVEAMGRWFSVYASRVGREGSPWVAIVFEDITDRKRFEQRQAYMLQLSDALRSLSDAVEIQATVTRTTMNLFGTDRCYYCEIIDGDIIIRRDAAREDLPSVVGVYPLENSPIFKAMLDAGQPFAVEDVHTTDILGENLRQACFQLQIISFIIVPVIKQGEPVGILSINQTTPRNWTAFEVDLAEEIADRTWATIERTRAEAELRESEIQRIQEQAAREQERQRAESLAELDRAKTSFFSNISHEFRTPLTLSLAPLQDALSDRTHPLDPVHQERLELVHRNSLRLLKLVNTLLDFSRIEAGRMEAVYEPTDLATFTTELTSVFRSAIEQAGLQLIVNCPPLPEPVFVDREMWEKIVLNLLSNAFKFTFEGEIRVSLRSTDSHQAILQIQDTGTGIAPEHLPHLFERFYQVRSTQARTHEGSGIGLALVHELVRLHGGTIEVSSTVGEGTCFSIALTFGTDHLPSDRLQFEGDRSSVRTLASTAMGATVYVSEAERWLPEEDTGNSAISASSSTARILLVDDNADMREYLTRILSEHVQVEAVSEGVTALAVAQERVPDLILSDVMMPGLDGFELLEALRADPRTREIPIILLSARAGEEAIVVGLEAGADDYLVKPFSAQELISRVTAHLQMAQLRGEALQEARSTLRSRDEFISVVSHELNTPLVSILGWTRMLRSSPPNPTMLSKALDTIERNATLQGKLVQDLLDLSRISAGKLRLNPQPIELQPVIETAIATVTQTATDKGIELTCQETVTEPVVVMGDSDRLSQVLINLLTNAIKFTPESGSVTLELSVVNNDGSADASYAEIQVTDTGIGIAADFLPHVFDRFRQAEGANAAKGLGLGLAIAHHIVELHNGTIHADSAGVGQGATFTVRLPLLQDGKS